ncbi:hypothetical protein WJX73_002952 [Symbiochloris irregularis]|uniref:Uncharacterized protein n=1 Tax=Symbiochloris irregularis TaxID=706552 RepID=A0AAW1P7K0_9CHLO
MPATVDPPRQFSAKADSSASGPKRVYADFSVYKGKAAMQLKIVSPTFELSQGSSPGLVVGRQGVVLLEFANAQQGTGTSPGQRRYDWERKQNFALSAVELAGLVEPHEQKYTHDPNITSSSKGNTMKNLTFNPNPQVQGGWFLSLQVQEGGQEAGRFAVPISQGEMACLRVLAHSVIPHLLGFDRVMSTNVPNAPQGDGFLF